MNVKASNDTFHAAIERALLKNNAYVDLSRKSEDLLKSLISSIEDEKLLDMVMEYEEIQSEISEIIEIESFNAGSTANTSCV